MKRQHQGAGLTWTLAGRAALALFALGCGGGSPAPAVPEPEQPPVAEQAPVELEGAPAPPILLRDVGLATPESALFDSSRDEYLVSNIDGPPAAEDGRGFISRISPEGAVVDLRFIDSGDGGVVLNAPKGMAFSRDTLYVTDVNVVRKFERNTGKPLGKVAIMSSSFLNDISVAPDGTAYVSDTGFDARGSELNANGKDAVYVIDPRGSVSVLAEGKELGQPNGLLADATGVWVVNLRGELYRLTREGERKGVVTLPGGSLDGLVQTSSGRLLVSSWDTSTVYVSGPPGQAQDQFTALITELNSPADLGYDDKRGAVLVPLFRDDALYVQEVPGG